MSTSDNILDWYNTYFEIPIAKITEIMARIETGMDIPEGEVLQTLPLIPVTMDVFTINTLLHMSGRPMLGDSGNMMFILVNENWNKMISAFIITEEDGVYTDFKKLDVSQTWAEIAMQKVMEGKWQELFEELKVLLSSQGIEIAIVGVATIKAFIEYKKAYDNSAGGKNLVDFLAYVIPALREIFSRHLIFVPSEPPFLRFIKNLTFDAIQLDPDDLKTLIPILLPELDFAIGVSDTNHAAVFKIATREKTITRVIEENVRRIAENIPQRVSGKVADAVSKAALSQLLSEDAIKFASELALSRGGEIIERGVNEGILAGLRETAERGQIDDEIRNMVLTRILNGVREGAYTMIVSTARALAEQAAFSLAAFLVSRMAGAIASELANEISREIAPITSDEILSGARESGIVDEAITEVNKSVKSIATEIAERYATDLSTPVVEAAPKIIGEPVMKILENFAIITTQLLGGLKEKLSGISEYLENVGEVIRNALAGMENELTPDNVEGVLLSRIKAVVSAVDNKLISEVGNTLPRTLKDAIKSSLRGKKNKLLLANLSLTETTLMNVLIPHVSTIRLSPLSDAKKEEIASQLVSAFIENARKSMERGDIAPLVDEMVDSMETTLPYSIADAHEELLEVVKKALVDAIAPLAQRMASEMARQTSSQLADTMTKQITEFLITGVSVQLAETLADRMTQEIASNVVREQLSSLRIGRLAIQSVPAEIVEKAFHPQIGPLAERLYRRLDVDYAVTLDAKAFANLLKSMFSRENFSKTFIEFVKREGGTWTVYPKPILLASSIIRNVFGFEIHLIPPDLPELITALMNIIFGYNARLAIFFTHSNGQLAATTVLEIQNGVPVRLKHVDLSEIRDLFAIYPTEEAMRRARIHLSQHHGWIMSSILINEKHLKKLLEMPPANLRNALRLEGLKYPLYLAEFTSRKVKYSPPLHIAEIAFKRNRVFDVLGKKARQVLLVSSLLAALLTPTALFKLPDRFIGISAAAPFHILTALVLAVAIPSIAVFAVLTFANVYGILPLYWFSRNVTLHILSEKPTVHRTLELRLQRRHQMALEKAEEALEKDDYRKAMYWLRVAAIYAEHRGRKKEAEELIAKVMETERQLINLERAKKINQVIAKGDKYVEQGRYVDALVEYHRALAGAKKLELEALIGQIEDKISECERRIEEHNRAIKEHNLRKIINDAQRAREAGKLLKAAGLYQHAADLAQELGRVDEAEEYRMLATELRQHAEGEIVVDERAAGLLEELIEKAEKAERKEKYAEASKLYMDAARVAEANGLMDKAEELSAKARELMARSFSMEE